MSKHARWVVDGVEIRRVGSHDSAPPVCTLPPGFNESDAPLIAAAPELRDSVDELLGVLEQMNLPAGGALDRARRAMAKARGEQP